MRMLICPECHYFMGEHNCHKCEASVGTGLQCILNRDKPNFEPMTNADRIGRLPDQVLEQFLKDLMYERVPGICVQYKSAYECDRPDKDCKECPKFLHNWLQAPYRKERK